LDIKNKNLLITGSSKRIGKFLALKFAEEGANIVVHYNSSKDEALKVCESIKSKGVKCKLLKANLEDEEEAKKLAYQALEAFGSIDVLINNASIYYSTPLFDEKNEIDLDKFYKIHVKAPFILSKIIGKHMYENKQGRIVNIADYSPLRPYRNFTPYIISKGALLTLTRALAKELSPHVLVNAVLPGPIIPPDDLEDLEKPLKKTLLKKWAGEIEIYKAVKYLVETDFTTGAFIPVEGGRLLC